MPRASSLTDLIGRYLPPATETCPTFAENSLFDLPIGERAVLNPLEPPRDLPPAPEQPEHPAEGTAVQAVRSYRPWSLYRHRALRGLRPANVVRAGIQEIYHSMTTAIGAAERYIYLEDQYFHEAPGGDPRFQLYGRLRAAARRGVKSSGSGPGARTRPTAATAPSIR